MSVFVVDASVAVKWYLPEEHTSEALRLLSPEHTLLAPDLIYSEVAAIVWKRVMQRREGVPPITSDEARAVVVALSLVPMDITPTVDLVAPALEIALATGRTVYDSLYVALASAREVDLVTADRRLYQGLASGPFAGRLAWVGGLR